MIKKHIPSCIFYLFAFIELILGFYITYKLSIEYAEPFGFFNFMISILLIIPVVFITISLICKGLVIYRIRTGEYGKVYANKIKTTDFKQFDEDFKNIDINNILHKITKFHERDQKQSTSAKEIIFYVLGAVVFALGLVISLVFSLSLAFFICFEFVVFAIPMYITIYVSLILLSKALNETFLRKYSKLHELQMLHNMLEKTSGD